MSNTDFSTPNENVQDASVAPYVLRPKVDPEELKRAIYVMNDWTGGQFYVFEERDAFADSYYERLYRQAEIALKYGFVKLSNSGKYAAQRILQYRDGIMSDERPIPYGAKRPKRRSQRGYVYVVRMGDTPYYKIGRTMDVAARLSQLQCGSPLPILVVAIVESNDFSDLESQLHKQFSDKRGNGEWFTLDDDDVACIKSLAVQE